MSDKYICLDCGHVFNADEAGSYREWIGEDRYESNSSGWMYYDACPECGSTEMAEAECCDFCGEYDDKDEMLHVGDSTMCRDCAREIYEAYWQAWGYAEKDTHTDIDKAKRIIELNTIPHASGYKNLKRVMEKSAFRRGADIGLANDTMVEALKDMGFAQIYDPIMRINVWEKGKRDG